MSSIILVYTAEMRGTLGCRGQVLQKCAIVRIHGLTFLLHFLLNLHRANDERIHPTPDHLFVWLALILEKLEERPEVPHDVPCAYQRLDIHKCVRESPESVVPIREGVEVLPEEEFGSRVDRESCDEVLEIERILGVSVEHDVNSFLGVPFEQIEV